MVQRRQIDEARQQLGHAYQKLAHAQARGLWSDLSPGFLLTARGLNSVWSLASADDAVRGNFIEYLIAEEIVRFGAGAKSISRALGLDWPTPAEAQRIVRASIIAMVQTTHQEDLPALIAAAQAAASKLTDTQAQQALVSTLQQIAWTNEPNRLAALARRRRP